MATASQYVMTLRALSTEIGGTCNGMFLVVISSVASPASMYGELLNRDTSVIPSIAGRCANPPLCPLKGAPEKVYDAVQRPCL